MDRLTQYRDAVRTQGKPANGDIEVQLLFDPERDHYQLVDLGWDGQRRIYNCVIHLDIRDGKVWIQRNQTDERIAEQLIALGVARADIILGLQPPNLRQYTEYGVA
ncbi:MAG: XisI protein [Oscillatoriales cyanobacterium C42_A2020_001]|nr:XisI protein [Leptolyngbyaceae cyanobacterium C42_A2020_001]